LSGSARGMLLSGMILRGSRSRSWREPRVTGSYKATVQQYA
jgi:hypothetical protein